MRELTGDDAEFILRLMNEPAWLRHIGDRGIRTVEAAREHIRTGAMRSYQQRGFGLWLVELRATGEAIGICGLIKRDSLPDVDLGFAFLTQHWSNGYAHEAARATLDYARTLGLVRVVAVVSPGNEPSARLLDKLRFRFERMTRLINDAPEVMLYASAL